MCFNYTSFSQELVRVIDTIIVLDISSSTDISSEVYGQQISPPTSKVWKIQSIIFDAGHKAQINYCNNNYSGAISSDEILCFIELDDGANNFHLCSSYPSGCTSGNSNGCQGLLRPLGVEQCVENIIWINSSSIIKIGVRFRIASNYNYCISDLTIKAHVSILEFENL